MVGGCILLGNISGFFRAAVTAYLAGTHAHADALAVATGPVDTLNSVLVNTMLFSFAPMLMLRRGADRSAMFAQAARLYVPLLTGLALLLVLVAGPVASVLGPGLGREQHEQVTALLRLLAPSIPFAGTAAIFSALLYTERRFLIPGLYQLCLNGLTVAGALTLWRLLGIEGFAIGYTCGALLQLAITWSATAGLRSRPAGEARFSATELLSRPGMFLCYALLIATNITVTRAFATHGGPGMASAFDYTWRCISVLIAYLVYPAASTLLPEISRLRSEGQIDISLRLISRSVALVAGLGAAAAVTGIAIRVPVIRLLFERGTFDTHSTAVVSGVFLGLAPGLMGWALMELMARCSFATGHAKQPLVAGFVPLTVNLAVSAFLFATGKLSQPSMIGAGAAIGMFSGFLVLFVTMRGNREWLARATG